MDRCGARLGAESWGRLEAGEVGWACGAGQARVGHVVWRDTRSIQLHKPLSCPERASASAAYTVLYLMWD